MKKMKDEKINKIDRTDIIINTLSTQISMILGLIIGIICMY